MDQPVILAMFGLIGGAFTWCATQIESLKKDLKLSVQQHMECEKARMEDKLEMLRLRYAIESLGRTSGSTDTIDRILNAPKPPIPNSNSEAGKETVVLSEEHKPPLK